MCSASMEALVIVGKPSCRVDVKPISQPFDNERQGSPRYVVSTAPRRPVPSLRPSPREPLQAPLAAWPVSRGSPAFGPRLALRLMTLSPEPHRRSCSLIASFAESRSKLNQGRAEPGGRWRRCHWQLPCLLDQRS